MPQPPPGLAVLSAMITPALLTSFYIALGVFVAVWINIGLATFLPWLGWVPGALGIAGTLVLFWGCVLLIRETRLALASVSAEMAFVLGLRGRFRSRPGTAAAQRRGPPGTQSTS